MIALSSSRCGAVTRDFHSPHTPETTIIKRNSMHRFQTLSPSNEASFLRMMRVGLAFFLLTCVSITARAQIDEDTGRKAAEELRVLVTEGTGVIGDLQPAINSGKTV